jgi:uncharacterized membrane protein
MSVCTECFSVVSNVDIILVFYSFIEDSNFLQSQFTHAVNTLVVVDRYQLSKLQAQYFKI